MRPEKTVPLWVVFACMALGCSPGFYLGRIALTDLADMEKPAWVWKDPSGSSPDKRAMVEGRPSVFCPLAFFPLASELTNPNPIADDDSSRLLVSGWVFPGFYKWLSGSPDLVGFRHQTGVIKAPSPALWTEQLLVPSLSSVRQLLLLF